MCFFLLQKMSFFPFLPKWTPLLQFARLQSVNTGVWKAVLTRWKRRESLRGRALAPVRWSPSMVPLFGGLRPENGRARAARRQAPATKAAVRLRLVSQRRTGTPARAPELISTKPANPTPVEIPCRLHHLPKNTTGENHSYFLLDLLVLLTFLSFN